MFECLMAHICYSRRPMKPTAQYASAETLNAGLECTALVEPPNERYDPFSHYLVARYLHLADTLVQLSHLVGGHDDAIFARCGCQHAGDWRHFCTKQ